MEQIKLITEHTIKDLELKINEFMATLDEHTDIIDVHIDSEYKEGVSEIYTGHLLATIRYMVHKEDHGAKKALKDLLEEMEKETVMNNSGKIAIVLGNFDFVKTQALMLDLDWEWRDGVPCVAELVDMAHTLLVKAGNCGGFYASGGFEATFHNGVFTLKFIVEESSNEDSFEFTPNFENELDHQGMSKEDREAVPF